MRRISELDAIRGITAVVIMVCHLKPREFGIVGVRTDLFFIVSSWLVTSIVLNKGRAPGFLVSFFVRRGLRIWPIYYATLGALVLFNPFCPKPFPLDGLPYYLTFTQNATRYWSDTTPPFNWYFLHTWSLALEMQFYVLWPVVVILAGRRRLVPISLSLVALAVVARSLGLHWWLLPARCDGFGLGALLACIFIDPEQVDRHRARLSRAFGLAVAASMAFAAATVAARWHVDLGSSMSLHTSLVVLAFNLCYFSITGLVLLNTGHRCLGVLRDPRLLHLGKVSYGIYMYHPFVFIVLVMLGRSLGLGEPLWLEGVKLLLTVVVASFSWRHLEQPILAWSDRARVRSGGSEPIRVPARPGGRRPSSNPSLPVMPPL